MKRYKQIIFSSILSILLVAFFIYFFNAIYPWPKYEDYYDRSIPLPSSLNLNDICNESRGKVIENNVSYYQVMIKPSFSNKCVLEGKIAKYRYDKNKSCYNVVCVKDTYKEYQEAVKHQRLRFFYTLSSIGVILALASLFLKKKEKDIRYNILIWSLLTTSFLLITISFITAINSLGRYFKPIYLFFMIILYIILLFKKLSPRG